MSEALNKLLATQPKILRLSLLARAERAEEMLKAQAAEIVSLRAERDALKAGSERYRWLLDYLVSNSTKHDDAIVEAKTSDELDAVISAAKEQG